MLCTARCDDAPALEKPTNILHEIGEDHPMLTDDKEGEESNDAGIMPCRQMSDDTGIMRCWETLDDAGIMRCGEMSDHAVEFLIRELSFLRRKMFRKSMHSKFLRTNYKF
jgi:hypothetical protein